MQIIIITITMIMMILTFGNQLHLKSKRKVLGLNKINGTRVAMLQITTTLQTLATTITTTQAITRS
jgi:multisubunit Na+/H+ antiporter MnhB subunit